MFLLMFRTSAVDNLATQTPLTGRGMSVFRLVSLARVSAAEQVNRENHPGLVRARVVI